MKVKSESEVAQSCPTLSDPMDCRPPGSSAHGIFQARVLEWVAIAFSANMLLEKSKEIAPEGMKRLSQSGNNAPLVDVLVVKVKSDAVKNSIE